MIPKIFRFSDLVEGLTGFKVLDISKDDKDQRNVLEQLRLILDEYARIVLLGNNKNISLRKLNDLIVESLSNKINNFSEYLKSSVLDTNSYGDIMIKHHIIEPIAGEPLCETYYLEIILTTQWQEGSAFRYLYLSDLRNIRETATHLLIIFSIDKDDNDYYILKQNPIIINPYDLKLHLKIEYNASLSDIKKLKQQQQQEL